MVSSALDSVKNYLTYENLQQTWSYTGRSLLLTRYCLYVIAKSCPQPLLAVCPAKIEKTVNYLKLASILGVPFTVINIVKGSQTLFASNNKKQVAIRSLQVTLNVADLFDTVTTLANAILSLSSKKAILPAAALPVALFLNVGNSLLRTLDCYQIWNVETKTAEKVRRLHVFHITASCIAITAIALFVKGVNDARPAALMALATAIRLYNIPPILPRKQS